MADNQPSPVPTGPLWTPDLQLGIPLIDGQHRRLVEQLAAVRDAVAAGRGAREVLQAIAFLEEYTTEHFHTEERYMAGHRYPGLERHRAIHAAFRSNVHRAVLAVEKWRGTGPAAELVERMLVHWYLRHIRGTDQKYAAHVKRTAGQ